MGVMLGRYELLRPIGRGGMAEVYLARRRGPGGVEKRLVVKRIRRESTRDPRFVQMFVDEARLSMSLSHKNIVPVFDFGRAGDELFLVMEYVDGADLAVAMAAAAAPLPPTLVAFLGLEACQALEYAHTRGIVHRDVTPTNVLVSRAGEVKLADFGVATAETNLGAQGTVRGTPLYMSPEQARGEPVGPSSDVFSLGLVLWEALAGRRAYAGADPAERLAAARRGEVPSLPDSAPPALRAAIARATHAQHGARFAAARELQLALDDYLVGARVVAAGEPPPADGLAGWLEAAVPEPAAGAGTAGVAPLAGEVVTFLDDGEQVSAVVGGRLGTGTQRSLAVTLAEPEPRAETGSAAAQVAGADARGGRGSRRVWSVVAAGAALAGGLAAAVVALALARESASGRDPGAPGLGVAAPPDVAAAASTGSPAPDAGAMVTSVLGPGASAAAVEATPAPRAPRSSPEPERPRRGSDAGADRRDAPVGSEDARDPGEPVARATLRVSAEPGWAEVSVVGTEHRCPQTPCQLELPPGRYELALRNPYSRLVGSRVVELQAGNEARVVVTLAAER